MTEAEQGYPVHKWLAIGHMAEAGDEIRAFSKEISDRIRQHRKLYEADSIYRIPILDLIQKITDLQEETLQDETSHE